MFTRTKISPKGRKVSLSSYTDTPLGMFPTNRHLVALGSTSSLHRGLLPRRPDGLESVQEGVCEGDCEQVEGVCEGDCEQVEGV